MGVIFAIIRLAVLRHMARQPEKQMVRGHFDR